MKANSLYSIFDRIIMAGLKFATVILIGYWLGTKGQGIFSLYLAIWAWTGIFSALGIGISNNYLGGKASSAMLISALFGNTITLSFMAGALSTVLTWFLAAKTDIFRALPSNQLNILLFGILLHAVYVPLLGLLLGLGEFKIKALSSIINFGCFLALLLWQHSTGTLSENVIGLDWLISIGLVMLVWCIWVLKRSDYKISLSFGLFKEQIGRGWKSYMYSLANGSLLRIDTLVVSYLLGADATGIYSVAVYFAEVLLYFPSAMTTVFLTAVGGGKQILKEMYRSISAIFLIAILSFALLIPIAVTFLFPTGYKQAILLAEMMLIGVYWLGMGSIGAFHRFGTEKLTVPFYAALIAVIGEVGIDILLVPAIGLIGAAIADTLAYVLFGFIILNSITKIYGCSIINLVTPINPLKMAGDLISLSKRNN
jgi:O-antigen/teichoic acid export membrane protein